VTVKALNNEVDNGRLVPSAGGGGVAADGRADDSEDARADDGSDAEGREGDGAEGLFERVFGTLGVGDQFVDGLGGEDLAGLRRSGQGAVLTVESCSNFSDCNAETANPGTCPGFAWCSMCV
jgi:hypothetical protein